MNDTNCFHTIQKRPDSKIAKPALDEPAAYELKVAQSLSDLWAGWFDGMEIIRDEHGNTLLSGTLPDQAALHGVLSKIRDLHLVLLSVMRK